MSRGYGTQYGMKGKSISGLYKVYYRMFRGGSTGWSVHLSGHAPRLLRAVSPVFLLNSISNYFPGEGSLRACVCMGA